MTLKTLKQVVAVASLVAAGSFTTEAQATKAFNGFNFGLVGGYGSQSSKLDVTTPAPVLTDSSDVGGQGFIGGVLIGWGRVFNNNHHFGIEASAKYANIDGNKTTNTLVGSSLNHKLKHKAAYDIAVRYGVVVGRALPFIKVGATYGSFKAETVGGGGLAGHTGSRDKHELGLIVGAGVEFAVSNNLSLGGEFNYTHHKDFSYDVKVGPAPGVTTSTVKVKPTTSTFMLRLKYSV